MKKSGQNEENQKEDPFEENQKEEDPLILQNNLKERRMREKI